MSTLSVATVDGPRRGTRESADALRFGSLCLAVAAGALIAVDALIVPDGLPALRVWFPLALVLAIVLPGVRRCLPVRLIAAVAACRAAIVVAENAADVIVRCDAAGRRVFVSPACVDVLGYRGAELLRGHALDLVHLDDQPHVAAALRRLGPQNTRSAAVFRMRRKDGVCAWMEARYRFLPDGGFVSVLRDVSVHKHMEASLADANARLAAANVALAALAAQDGLTGLANRRHFDLLLEHEFRRAVRMDTPLGLVLIDVDHFKAFNDRYGHPAGDDCLRAISDAVRGQLRRGGELAARYGGEEIAVLLPGLDADATKEMAQRIAAAVRGLGIAHQDGAGGMVTISAGVSALAAFRPGTPRDLVEAADQALYWAKAAGRNSVQAHAGIWSPHIDGDLSARRGAEQQIAGWCAPEHIPG